MGTVFQVPWTRLESWPGDAQLIKDAGYTLVGMTLGEGHSFKRPMAKLRYTEVQK